MERPPERGLVVVQIDGLSRPLLDDFLAAGHLPVLAGLIADGRLALDDWIPMIPPCTPASQSGILHGRNDDIPGFRWFEKDARRLMVANHAHDAAEIERRQSDGRGLLAKAGASIGNLLAGEAEFSHLTMATIEDGAERRGPADAAGFTRSLQRWARIAAESFTQLFAEARDARRQRVEDVRPRIPRGVRFAVERAVTNVALRILSTELVCREIQLGRDTVYVDFTGFDETAHHCGPGRPETIGATRRIDASLGEIVAAIDAAARPYDLVVLSDHGQSLGWTFYQRHGVTLEEFIASRTGSGRTYHGATGPAEYAEGLLRLGHHVTGHRFGGALAGFSKRRPGTNHHRTSRLVDSHGAPLANPADAEEADVVVCASGNLALVYLTDINGAASEDDIEAEHPGLIGDLVAHPGVGLVVVRTSRGVEAIGRDGTMNLDSGQVIGRDPLDAYRGGETARRGLARVARFSNSGDLLVLGRYDAATGQVVSFEELVGSHGGLGGPQSEPFIAHPPRWRLDGALIGAPAVHQQLVAWRRSASANLGGPATGTEGAQHPEEGERRGQAPTEEPEREELQDRDHGVIVPGG